MNKTEKFLINYLISFSDIINNENQLHLKLIEILKLLKKYKNKKRVHIFGNGGSATIANHFSMDLTNNSSIKCISYNDPSLITCYANDFKFENWISRTIHKYGEAGDLLILISSSGESKNMIKASKAAKKKKFHKIITFTGFKKNNKLSKIGNINFWVNSKNYNLVESSHHFFLLTLVDLVKLSR